MARPLLELQACSALSGQAFLISTFEVAHDCCPAACPGDDTNGRALAIPTGMGRLSTSLQSSSSPGLIKTNCQNCAVWTCGAIRPGLSCNYRADEKSWRARCFGLEENTTLMTHAISKLRKAAQPPLSYRGAAPDSDRAKKPPLSEPAASGQELNPGDRVEGLGDFGKPTGELGTVQQANEDDAIVKWDDDGRMRVHQPSLKKV